MFVECKVSEKLGSAVVRERVVSLVGAGGVIAVSPFDKLMAGQIAAISRVKEREERRG